MLTDTIYGIIIAQGHPKVKHNLKAKGIGIRFF